MAALPEFQKYKNVIILGDEKVGKTSLIIALKKIGKATPTSNPGDIHEIEYKGSKFQLVDVAGKSHQHVTPNTTRYARIVILAYDITRQESLNNCKYWHQFAMQNCTRDTVSYALVGCKSDLNSDRQVSWDDMERVSKMIGPNQKLEVSAVKQTNCRQLLDWIRGIMGEGQQDDNGVGDSSFKLSEDENSSGCKC